MINFVSLFSKLCKKGRFSYIVNSKIDKNAKVYSGSSVVNSSIGKYSYCGYDCTILNAQIGKFCSIAGSVVIGAPNHPIKYVSSSPAFTKGRCAVEKFSNLEFNAFGQTFIGNDVWIGERALIKQGIKIGDGAVIGMGSIVTHDVEPYTIVAGNPAKEIRKRFDELTIKKLQAISWWDFNEKKLKEISPLMNDVNSFIDKCSSKHE